MLANMPVTSWRDLGRSMIIHPLDVLVAALHPPVCKAVAIRGRHRTRARISPMLDFGMPVRKTETTAAPVKRAGTVLPNRHRPREAHGDRKGRIIDTVGVLVYKHPQIHRGRRTHISDFTVNPPGW